MKVGREQAGKEFVEDRSDGEHVTHVPLLDLRMQYARIKDEVREAMDRVLESQRFILGPEVEALEKEVAEYSGCRWAVGVSSGTDALLVSLMALGIGPGDEVVTTPFSFFATAGAIVRLGARPVFVDIDPGTFNINPELAAAAVGSRTKALMPVHLFGQCADMDPLMEIARRHGLHIIEDAAQAIGAEYSGKRAGSMGTAGCFSFFPSKNLGAFGDGGMVTTNDADLAEKIKILRNQGAEPKYYHKVLGGNFRLDALQAAVLRVKLKHLDGWTEMRRANAAFYTSGLRDLWPGEPKVVPPPIRHERHIFNQYVIRTGDRDGLRDFLSRNGIDTEIYYPQALHKQQCLAHVISPHASFPVSEEASGSVLALPIYPELTDPQKSYIISKIKEFFD
ncbi:MAG: DegT/DnrJ/EryC1/StrS family aminotransferase [Desulfomonilaceae bacterium]|nr:DegT/DnrJ/EryC1/StrS family aminotransferase [Desulfomonilaceae bacterium]